MLCEMLKKVASLSGNIITAKHIQPGSVAKSLTEVSIEFTQISLFNEPEALRNIDNLSFGYLKYKPNNCIEPWHTQP